jgi:hypothetical protein
MATLLLVCNTSRSLVNLNQPCWLLTIARLIKSQITQKSTSNAERTLALLTMNLRIAIRVMKTNKDRLDVSWQATLSER